MASLSKLDLFFEVLHSLRVENTIAQHFIPDDELLKVMSKETVIEVLTNVVTDYLLDEVINFVISRAPKVFCILVLIKQVCQIQKFMQYDHYGINKVDHQLPFTRHQLQEILQKSSLETSFFEKQWEFTAPTFSGQIVPRVLNPWTVLPYTSDVEVAKGGYGNVYKISIHPSYHPASHPTVSKVRRFYASMIKLQG